MYNQTICPFDPKRPEMCLVDMLCWSCSGVLPKSITGLEDWKGSQERDMEVCSGNRGEDGKNEITHHCAFLCMLAAFRSGCKSATKGREEQ